MELGRKSGRLLWNDPKVLMFAALALLSTAAIIAWQVDLRSGVYDAQGLGIFRYLFLFQDYPGSLLFVAVLLLALVPGVQLAGRFFALLFGSNPGAVALVVFLCLAVGARWVYGAHPLSMDESAPLMQSKAFASGEILGRFPPALLDWVIYPPFQGYFIHVSRSTGEVAAAYWPGFALLLAPFTAVGMPWLCNPLLGAASILVVHRLAMALTASSTAAGSVVLFTLASAAFVINAISFYSMTAHLICNAVFALLLLRPTLVRSALAGLIGGLALTLHNPVPHILFALPWFIWMLGNKDRLRLVPCLVAGYLPLVIVVGFGWHHTLQGLAAPQVTTVSTGLPGPLGDAFQSLSQVLSMPDSDVVSARLIGMAKTWLWASPGLVLLAGVGFWRRRHDARFVLLLASFVLTFVGYLFVPMDQGHGWGFRYIHSAWFVLPIIAGAATGGFDKKTGRAAGNSDGLVRYAEGAALGGLVVMIPFFAWQVQSFIVQHVSQLPSTDHGQPHVVIINPGSGYYSQDLIQNDPFLRDPVARMVTHGRKQDELMMAQYFPGLVLLSRDYRGSVWGRPDRSEANASVASFLVGGGVATQ